MGMPKPMRSPGLRSRVPFAPALLVFFLIGTFLALPCWPRRRRRRSKSSSPLRKLRCKLSVKAVKDTDHRELTAIFAPDREKLMSAIPSRTPARSRNSPPNLDKSATLETVKRFEVHRPRRRRALAVADPDREGWPQVALRHRGGNRGDFEPEDRRERAFPRSQRAAPTWWRSGSTTPNRKGSAEDGLAVYAQRFISTPGERDGPLLGNARGRQTESDGSLVAQARVEGYPPGTPKSSDEAEAPPYQRILPQDPQSPGAARARRQVQATSSTTTLIAAMR